MPMGEYAALLALLTEMSNDVEAVVSDAEAKCDVEAARGGDGVVGGPRVLLASMEVGSWQLNGSSHCHSQRGVSLH